jgi:hypothetical protein
MKDKEELKYQLRILCEAYLKADPWIREKLIEVYITCSTTRELSAKLQKIINAYEKGIKEIDEELKN